MRLAFALPIAAVVAACATVQGDLREAEIASVFARADQPLLRGRPQLVAGKYARMANGLYDFYRGGVPLFLHDFREIGGSDLARSRFALTAPLVLGMGDAHPENFGVLHAGDGSFALEPNDFDGADHVPYLWDLRRLTVGMVVAAYASNEGDAPANAVAVAAARDIARATAEGYARSIAALANGAPRARVTESGGNAMIDDALRRSVRDTNARAELATLTRLEGGVRTMVRGVFDATDPQNVYVELPDNARRAIPEALRVYRATLVAPPPEEYFVVLDAVRELGGGVASWPRVRAAVLVRGPTDAPGDDVVLEMKELADSGLAGWYPPGLYYDSVQARVLEASRASWARPDAESLWGATTWLGLPTQVRREAEGQKTLRVSRMVGARGTPAVLVDLGAQLAAILARVHATEVLGVVAPARAIADRIGADVAGFADEQADVSVVYGARVVDDWAAFKRALDRLGPSLGVPADPSDAPSADVAALYGHPPAPVFPKP